MTPMEMLVNAIRDVLAQGRGATTAELEHLRGLALHVLDHDATPNTEARAALRDVLDTDQRPDARSWQTDSGIGRSRFR